MANPEHLKVVKQGKEAIKKWREANPGTTLDLSEANLDDAYLYQADLINADLAGALLNYADMNYAELVGANLTRADLKGANLSGANLTDADLTGAILVGANLEWARLFDADLNYATCAATVFIGLDLTQPKGLDTILHDGPCYIDMSTLTRSRGKIPESFLRGCGLAPWEVIQSRLYNPDLSDAEVAELQQRIFMARTKGPLKFYSCFISYTEADDAFSKKLYDDLQEANVRCWRWKEDARWGRTLRKEIAEGIRVYDKLIVICSKHSLKAPAVLREIERALQKEDTLQAQGKGPDVLFPIRIDDYIFSEQFDHQTKEDLHAKTIGDFTHTDNPQAYQDALQRLLKSLNPGT